MVSKIKELIVGSIVFMVVDRLARLISSHVANKEHFSIRIELLVLFLTLFIAIKISL